MFNPNRFDLARRRRGLTKTRLAQALGVDRRTIRGYEAGEYPPSAESLELMTRVLRFPADFFFGDDLEELSPETASFRSMSKMTAAQRDMALSQGSLAVHFNQWLDLQFQFPSIDLPDLRHEKDPEAAAAALRQVWGLGQQPIKNLLHLLESKGVRVFSLSVDARELDAFSLWHDGMPFVFLNTYKSAEHSRFDAAHELGHLLLHRHGAPSGREAEAEADNFASALLMPRGAVLAARPRFATLEQLIRLKRQWTVSLSALTYRLHAVEALSDWHYRNLCIEISKRGFRKSEPEEAPRELSQTFTKIFLLLKKEGISRQEIARQLTMQPAELDQLTFGLMIQGLSEEGDAPALSSRRPVPLRLVK